MRAFFLFSFILIATSLYCPAVSSRERVYELRQHDPIYFVAGEKNSKVQLSFKYKFLKRADLYFGYTQRMFWDFYTEPSSPIRDLNYSPEFFYSLDTEDENSSRYRFGVGHDSNGEGKYDSRMYNRIYVEALYDNLIFDKDEILLGLQHIFDEDYYSPDIARYVGPFYADFTFHLGYGFFRHLFYRISAGSNIDYITQVYGMNFRVFDNESSLTMFAQYFDGYGEALRYYDRRDQALRAGFIIGY